MVCKYIFAFCWLLVLRIYLFFQVVQCIGHNCLWLSLLLFCVSVLSVLTSHSLFLIWVFSFSFSLANNLSILFIFSQSNSQFHWSFMLIFWSLFHLFLLWSLLFPSFYQLWACKWKLLRCVWLFATPWTAVHGIVQARILEWVAFPFSRGSFQPRDRTQVSCIAGGFFTSWATRVAQEYWSG